MWMPSKSLSGRPGPKYKALVEEMIQAVEGGELRVGDRLPTHRELAYRLGVSVQTVSAAYKEVERQGYIRSDRRRGTFVQRRVVDSASHFILDSRQPDLIDLSTLRPVYNEGLNAQIQELFQGLSQELGLSWMHACRPVAGLEEHRRIGADWLAGFGLELDPAQVVITNGTAQGIFTALGTVVQANDLVVTDELTDTGVIGCASVLRYNLQGLKSDEQGILPEAFEAVCQANKVKALVCTPSYNNPTASLMGEERRRQIAEIAERHSVFVIEDDVCRLLLEEDLPPISSLVPELGFYCTSFTKSVIPGLRTGYLAVPSHLSMRAVSVLRVTGWMGTPVMAEMAARWIEDGTIDAAAAFQRTELKKRQRLVARVLSDAEVSTAPTALSAWIPLPEAWNEDWFVEALRKHGIALTASAPFMPRKLAAINAVRLAFGGATTLDELENAAEVIRQTMEQVPGVHMDGDYF